MTNQHHLKYMGKTYPLKAQINQHQKKVTLSLKADHILLEAPQGGQVDYSAALKRFYTQGAKKYIQRRLKDYESRLKVSYKSFSIEADDRKWGSCDSNRHLTFHYALAQFEPAVIDYVIVHELCHLQHMNHDRSFWRLVGKWCPNHKDYMAVLGTTKTRDM